MKKSKKFDPAAKARITRAETAKHGHIPAGSFGSVVQGIVDRTVPKPGKGAKTSKIKQ